MAREAREFVLELCPPFLSNSTTFQNFTFRTNWFPVLLNMLMKNGGSSMCRRIQQIWSTPESTPGGLPK
jgi:hypothetical protein